MGRRCEIHYFVRIPNQVWWWQEHRILSDLRQRRIYDQIRTEAQNGPQGCYSKERNIPKGNEGGQEQGKEGPRYRCKYCQAQGQACRRCRLKESRYNFITFLCIVALKFWRGYLPQNRLVFYLPT